jgi:outer membrane protein W
MNFTINNPKELQTMRKYSLIAVLLLSFGFAVAQDSGSAAASSSSSEDYAPTAGDISGAILFGRGNFLTTGLDVAPSPNNSWTVPGSAPYNNTVDVSDNEITNMVGVEVRYFLLDNIALKLSGGAILRNTPARTNIPGFVDSGTNSAAWIPAYASVVADNRADVNINLGGEYHFSSKYSRLFPYAGVTIPFYYGRRSNYNPTIADGTSPNDPLQITDIGVRHTEIVGFGGQVVGGVDYYLLEGLYFGFEIKPIGVVYAYSVKSPGPGLEVGEAENTTWSFFSQPFFKVGFRF